jgi:hypothetical protein
MMKNPVPKSQAITKIALTKAKKTVFVSAPPEDKYSKVPRFLVLVKSCALKRGSDDPPQLRKTKVAVTPETLLEKVAGHDGESGIQANVNMRCPIQ